MYADRTVMKAASTAANCFAVLAAIAAVAIVLIAASDRAWADGPEDCPPGTGWNPTLGACIQIEIPGGDPGNPDPGGGESVCRDQDGSEVPCSKDGLTWWGAPRFCYAAPESPQSPPPRGHEDETGLWWSCSTSSGDGAGSGAVWWAPDGDAPVDPVAVATTLKVQIPYELANAQIAPPPTYHTYISYKNWMWVDEAQWRTVSATASLRGATVTLSATPTYVSWDMGNGDTVSCAGPGRAWVTGMPEAAPTNCSYAYAEMVDPTGDTWTVTAQINYTLAWTCSGNCGGQTSGDLGEQLAAAGETTTITVYQRQTVNKNGG